MKTSTLAGSVLASLALIATPLQGQAVSGEVVVRSGPVAGRVVVGDEYSSYRQARRVVVVERYAPRVIVVQRIRHGHDKHWRRHGYHRVVVYRVDGRYYDRDYPNRRGMQEVVVYERGGRYYQLDDDHRAYRGGRERYDYRNQDWDDEARDD